MPHSRDHSLPISLGRGLAIPFRAGFSMLLGPDLDPSSSCQNVQELGHQESTPPKNRRESSIRRDSSFSASGPGSGTLSFLLLETCDASAKSSTAFKVSLLSSYYKCIYWYGW
jgi:hypothetical protein